MSTPLWDFSPPPPAPLQDRDVQARSQRLQGKRIALLLSGSIAAYRAPDLIRELRRDGAEVQVYATEEALRYVAREALEWTSLHPVLTEASAQAEHLSDQRPFSAFLLAPATYNVLNKFAQGIADDLLTSLLASALGRLGQEGTPILTVPTMHGSMHNQILRETLRRLHELGVIVLPPRQENGKNNLPELEFLVAHLTRALSPGVLQRRNILVTGGPTPVRLDHVRLLTNRFTGGLALEIAKQAWLEQAEVTLILGQGSLPAPSYLQETRIADYDEYRTEVMRHLACGSFDTAFFSAAVADYRPAEVYPGKLPSGQELILKLEQTPKVIREVRAAHPRLKMVTFKYEENRTHAELMAIARNRTSDYQLVVANRGEEFLEAGEQVAWLVEEGKLEQRFTGKAAIARALIERIASWS